MNYPKFATNLVNIFDGALARRFDEITGERLNQMMNSIAMANNNLTNQIHYIIIIHSSQQQGYSNASFNRSQT